MKEIFYKLFEQKNIARLMSKDWLLKFLSLVLAIILWYFVGGEDKINKNVMIPIEIINLPRDLTISNQFKKEIEVTVSGPRSLILEMGNRAVTRQVDLSMATPGTMVIENDHKHIPVPRGITIQRVQPSSIILSLDKLIQKRFPVEARTTGEVAHGYFIKSLKVAPDAIAITGPQTTLSQVDHFFTKTINLDSVKKSMQLQVPLQLDPAIVELIGETSVTVDVMVGLQTVPMNFDTLKVTAVVDEQVREVRPDRVKVVANVPKLLLEKKVDLKNLITAVAVKNDGEANLKVKIIPRADLEIPIEIVSLVPETVQIVETGMGSTAPKGGEQVKVLPPVVKAQIEPTSELKAQMQPQDATKAQVEPPDATNAQTDSPVEHTKMAGENENDRAGGSEKSPVKIIKKIQEKIIY